MRSEEDLGSDTIGRGLHLFIAICARFSDPLILALLYTEPKKKGSNSRRMDVYHVDTGANPVFPIN
jgi:hypothetical protein